MSDALERAKAIAARLSKQAIGSDVLGKRNREEDGNWSWGNGAGGVNTGGMGEKKRQKVFIPVDKYPDINFLGLLIGPRGSNQKRMEESSGAKILIRGKGSSKDGNDPSESEDLHVLITADTAEQIAKAQEQVEKIIFNPEEAMQLKQEQLRTVAEMKGISTDFGIGSGGGGSGGHYGPSITSAEAKEDYQVPKGMVGFVIGRGGETIRELQMKSGAHIQVQRETEADKASQFRIINIAGSTENVEKAKKYIKNLLEERQNTGRSAPTGSETIQIKVSGERVGLVIGRGGITVKSIQERTGTIVQIPNTNDEDNPNIRTLTIVGSLESCEMAKREISSIVDGDNNNGGNDVPPGGNAVFIQVPNDKVGIIIGRKGETIKGIQERTGTKIQIPNQPDPGSNPPIRTLSITGMAGGPEQAKYEVECILAGQLQTDHYGGGAYGQQQYGQYDASNYYGYAGYDETNQQYGQYYAQQYQAQTTEAIAAPGTSVASAQEGQVSDPNAAYDPNTYWNGYYEYAAYYGVEAANAAWGVTAEAAAEMVASTGGVTPAPGTEQIKP